MEKKTGEIIVPTEPTNPPAKVTGFTFKSYDKKAGVLQFEIKNQDGSPTDLINATVRLFMYIYSGEEKKEFPIFDNQIITESYMQGIVKYFIPDMLLAYEGKVDANVYIDFPDGSHTDNLAFTFNIEKSIIDRDVQLNGEYYFKDFQQLLGSVKKEATDAVNEALFGVDQTISEAEKKLNNFVQSVSKDVTKTISQLTEELQDTETTVTNVSKKANQIQTDLVSVQNELINAEEYFVKQKSLEKGPFLFKNTHITTQNWNDITESGVYYCAGATGENMPISGTLYGYLIVIKSASVIVQLFISNGNFYNRVMSGSPLTWFNWNKLSNDSKVVHNSGNESIDGFKDFRQTPTVNNVPVALDQFISKTVKTTNTTDFTNESSVRFERDGRSVVANFSITNKSANFAGWKNLMAFPKGYTPTSLKDWGGTLANKTNRNPALSVYANASGIAVMVSTTNLPENQECSGTVSYFTNDAWPN
ncbi:BppU family phage baseplate upper protein [Enterococcus hirae]|nr:BppU family phage baseplate upper protein [Enterococcus hirae]EMF0520158.1 BppU family phage baseplate upper protein [Enterococcus hirae]